MPFEKSEITDHNTVLDPATEKSQVQFKITGILIKKQQRSNSSASEHR